VGRRQLGVWAVRVGLALALALALGASDPPAAPGPAVHVDEQGRRYEVHSLEKGWAERVDAGHARTRWGHLLELVGEDEAHWLYKFYLPPPAAAPPGAARPPEAPAPAPVALPESATLRFVPFGAGLPTSGQWRDGFDLADLDGDGHPDLVHGPARKGARRPALFLNDGRGGWRPWGEAHFPDLPYDYGDAAAGDLDGDGALDLVFAVHLRGLLALRGDGRGGFVRAGEGLDFAETGLGSFSSRSILLLDFDGDGRLDVLALGEGPRLGASSGARGAPVVGGARGVVLYHGLGDARFARRDRGTGNDAIFGRTLALGDFDGDGHTDFATASSQLGRQDLVHLAIPEGLWRDVRVDAVPPLAYVPAVAAADFDGDGRADLAVAWTRRGGGEWWSGIDLLSPGADGSWRRSGIVAERGREGPRALASGDLDADGAPDLVALDGSGATRVFRGDGHGGFRRETAPPPPYGPGCAGSHVAVADLDGDGRGDVVASFARERSAPADPDVCPGEGGLAAWRSLPR
jgi:hypothetical protein